MTTSTSSGTLTGVATLVAVLAVAFGAVLYSGPANGPTYDSLSAADKAAFLWSRVTANETSAAWPTPAEVGKVLVESMQPTVSYVSDELPEGRTKVIHSVAVMAQARWVAFAGNYTGILGQGADNLLLRFSSAGEPNTTLEGPAAAFVPAVAIKALIDGEPSQNLFAMHSTGAKLFNPNWDFFARQLSTHASGTGATGPIGPKFATVSKWEHFLGTSGFASLEQTGTAVELPHYPWQLVFVPGTAVRGRFPPTFDTYFTKQLATLPVGTEVYEVWAKETPGAHPVEIGSLQLTSRFTESNYGDTKLFFKHTTFDEDIIMGAGTDTVKGWLAECPTMESCPTCPADFDCFAK